MPRRIESHTVSVFINSAWGRPGHELCSVFEVILLVQLAETSLAVISIDPVVFVSSAELSIALGCK